MMQNKNELDDMAKKYKEEMMRLYSRNRARPTDTQTARNVQAPHAGHSADDTGSAEAVRDLSRPPMPEIPENYNSQAEQTTQAAQPKQMQHVPAQEDQSAKFPSPDEIMRNENHAEEVPGTPAAVDGEGTEHNQGNYDFPPYPEEAGANNSDSISDGGGAAPDESYPDENTDFSNVDGGEDFPEDNPSDMSGQGYLQIEVTTASGAIPVRDATVIITESLNGKDSLIGMSVTDSNGATPVIALSAPSRSFSEAPGPSERPYSEYNIGVYKKGFYAIPKLTVPIFDTIKSIQPVAVIPLAEFEFGGAEFPDPDRINSGNPAKG